MIGLHLHGKCPGPYSRDGASSEIARVLALLQGCAHEHNPEVRSLDEKPPENDQEELAMPVSLMNLSMHREKEHAHTHTQRERAHFEAR